MDVSIHEIHFYLSATTNRKQQIKDKTAKDEILHCPRSFIAQGWPDRRLECPTHLHAFFNYRDGLAVPDGIILKGKRIAIPKNFQAEVLQQLNYAHQGSGKLRAQEAVVWANINYDEN